jgi:hypothetical protein
MISNSHCVKESRNFIEDVDRLSSDLSRLLKASRDAIEQSKIRIARAELKLAETRIWTQRKRWLKQRDNVFQLPDRRTYSLARVHRGVL